MDQNKKPSILKKIKELNLQVNQCLYCNGTGLFGVSDWLNDAGIMDHAWTGEYCDKCNGLGFSLPDKDFVLYLCDHCNGTGFQYNNYHNLCFTCKGEGVLDWIQFIRNERHVGNL
jgi:DnaJ-class molecular chaperone